MASIKKVRPIRIIEEREFIDAFNLHALEPYVKYSSVNMTDKKKIETHSWLEMQKEDEDKKLRTQNEDEYNKEVSAFLSRYGQSWVDTVWEIFRWKTYIFKGKSSIPSLEGYGNYVECISKNQKEPLKTIRWENAMEVGVEWVFNGYVYDVKGLYTDDEIRLLILEDFDKERRYFEKLKIKFDETKEYETTNDRPRIPENIRIEVWRRDAGKCARCGSRENLEYDHIVPISRGGSNTSRNIELLCEKHNRSKSNNVV